MTQRSDTPVDLLRRPYPSPVSAVRRSVPAAVTVGIVLLAAACSSGGAAFESIRDSNDNADRVRAYASWDELVELARVEKATGDPVQAAIVGGVVDVEEGLSFTWDIGAEGGEKRTEVAFGNKDAMVSTYHLTVKVTSVLGSAEIREGAQVPVGIAVDADVTLEDVKKDFADLTDTVFFLQTSPVFDYEQGLFAIVEDGALLAVPDDDGTLAFPLLPEDDPVQPPEEVTSDDLGTR